MNKVLNHWTGEAGVALIAGVVLAYGWLIMTIGFHDYAHPQEDSQVVWTCFSDGNGRCGTDTPKVQIDLTRLLDRR